MANIRQLSPKFRVVYNGFHSDTYTLQQNGWRVAVEEQPHDNRFRLYIENIDTQLRGISDFVSFDYHARLYSEYVHLSEELPIIHIRNIVNKINVIRMNNLDQRAFVEIDARPTYTNSPITSEEDFKVFSTHKLM